MKTENNLTLYREIHLDELEVRKAIAEYLKSHLGPESVSFDPLMMRSVFPNKPFAVVQILASGEDIKKFVRDNGESG